MEASKATPASVPGTVAKDLTLTAADGAQDPATPHPAQHGVQGEHRHPHEGDAPQGCREGRDRGTERVSERHGRLGSIPGKAGTAGPCRTCQMPWGGLPSPSGAQGSVLEKWEGQQGMETPQVCLQRLPTLWGLGLGR